MVVGTSGREGEFGNARTHGRKLESSIGTCRYEDEQRDLRHGGSGVGRSSARALSVSGKTGGGRENWARQEPEPGPGPESSSGHTTRLQTDEARGTTRIKNEYSAGKVLSWWWRERDWAGGGDANACLVLHPATHLVAESGTGPETRTAQRHRDSARVCYCFACHCNDPVPTALWQPSLCALLCFFAGDTPPCPVYPVWLPSDKASCDSRPPRAGGQ